MRLITLILLLPILVSAQKKTFMYKPGAGTSGGKVSVEWYVQSSNGIIPLTESSRNTVNVSSSDNPKLIIEFSNLELGYTKDFTSIKKNKRFEHGEFFRLEVEKSDDYRPSQLQGITLLETGSHYLYDSESNHSPKTFKVVYQIIAGNTEISIRPFVKAVLKPFKSGREIQNRNLEGVTSELELIIGPDKVQQEVSIAQNTMLQEYDKLTNPNYQPSIIELNRFISKYQSINQFASQVKNIDKIKQQILSQAQQETKDNTIENINNYISNGYPGEAVSLAEKYDKACTINQRKDCSELEFIRYILIMYKRENDESKKDRIERFKTEFLHSKYLSEFYKIEFEEDKKRRDEYRDRPVENNLTFPGQNTSFEKIVENVETMTDDQVVRITGSYYYKGRMTYQPINNDILIDIESNDESTDYLLSIVNLNDGSERTVSISQHYNNFPLIENSTLKNYPNGYYEVTLFGPNREMLDKVENVEIKGGGWKIPRSAIVVLIGGLLYFLYWSYQKFLKL